MEKNNSLVSTPVAILVGAILISLSILISGGAVKIKGFNSGAAAPAPGAPSQTGDSAAAPVPEPSLGPVKISLDDDPVEGDKNAPVTLVEFSDYECPFCKRHFDQTYSQLKKNYIDTGKVKLVFRDFPLSFHDPMATTEAIAANCAREQGGDGTYFKLHDLMFTNTTSNGSGLTKDQLNKFAGDLGLNVDNFKSCVDSQKYKEEVTKDIADGTVAGTSGTPSFIIGKSTGSEIEGKLIVGAQPYAAFQSEIDSLLQ